MARAQPGIAVPPLAFAPSSGPPGSGAGFPGGGRTWPDARRPNRDGVNRSYAQQVERVRREHYALWREGGPRTVGVARPPATPGLEIGPYPITPTSAARGKTLAELDLPRVAGAIVVALVRGGEVVASPRGAVTAEPDDLFVLLGTNDQLDRAVRVLDNR